MYSVMGLTAGQIRGRTSLESASEWARDATRRARRKRTRSASNSGFDLMPICGRRSSESPGSDSEGPGPGASGGSYSTMGRSSSISHDSDSSAALGAAAHGRGRDRSVVAPRPSQAQARAPQAEAAPPIPASGRRPGIAARTSSPDPRRQPARPRSDRQAGSRLGPLYLTSLGIPPPPSLSLHCRSGTGKGVPGPAGSSRPGTD